MTKRTPPDQRRRPPKMNAANNDEVAAVETRSLRRGDAARRGPLP
jgi:hypothetical protein